MKKLAFLSILLAITVLFTNCEEKEDTVKVDFEIIVTGESPNAIVQLSNTSDEADSFIWTFSEGADVETSEEANPQITVDKVGEFSITLTATTGSSENTKTKKVNITGVNGIYSYDDVIIGELNHLEIYGCLLDCQNGIVYKENNLSSTKGEKVDIAIRYNADYSVRLYNPVKASMVIISNAQETLFNLNENNSITVADFDNIQTDQFYYNVEYAEDYYIRVEFNEIPTIIPFKDHNGKYGLVKIQEIFPEHLLMDVKAQKYVASE
jgi:hypothetical protein